ncbi:auxin efflux carrier [Aquibacillus halophilus]|uniref:Auxin efflux carrier n=1 Tax=Aquibacillus halophilus TaxID=930132 RepID=A0A6A8DI05_9BACI|nr:AEC family transporter [Aquibacillus halophilus]MRH42547.1 auxin efflux carrier [Aquibacillus halophilus]
MDLLVITSTIAVMGLIIGLGVLTASQIPITKELKSGIMFIIINIAVPSIILNGIFSTEVTSHLLNQVLVIFVFSISFHILSLLFSFTTSKLFNFQSLSPQKLSILSTFGNTGFIGIPLCATIFGPTGGLLAAIFDSAMDLVIFTIGIYMLQSHGKFKLRQLKALVNPPLIAITVGLLAAVTGFDPPDFIKQLTGMLSAIAAPLAMIYVGMLIPPLIQRKGLLFYSSIWFPLSFKLLILPIITFVLISFTYFDGLIKNIIIIQASMPTFMLATVLFSRYTDDEETAVLTTIYSTILCLFTIPFISILATWWGLS